MQNNRKIGSLYEKIAVEYLEKRGLKLICRNYRCKFGEIDIIMQDKDYLVFCEVKYRKYSGFGFPLEAVNIKKENKIRNVAKAYIVTNEIPNDAKIRFDCIGILGNDIEWIKNAF